MTYRLVTLHRLQTERQTARRQTDRRHIVP